MTMPESWQSEELLASLREEVDFIVPAYILVAVHGNLVLALKHPDNPQGPAREAASAFLDMLEEIFRAIGLEEPSWGWRGAAVSSPLPRCHNMHAYDWTKFCDLDEGHDGEHYSSSIGFWGSPRPDLTMGDGEGVAHGG